MELIFRTILDKSYEERLKADVEKIRQEIGKPVNVRIQGDEAGKARTIIIQTVDAMGNLVDITFKYDAVAQQFIPTQTKIVLLDILAYFLWEETTARELSPFHVGFGKMLYKEIL